MKNIKLGTRLAFGFGVVVLLSVLLGSYALRSYAQLQTLMLQIETRDFAALQATATLTRSEDQLRNARQAALVAGFLRRDRLAGDLPEAARRRWLNLHQENARLLASLETSLSQWESSAVSSQRAAGWRKAQSLITETRRLFDAISPEAEAMFALVSAGNLVEAHARMGDVERAAAVYEARLGDVQRAIQDNIQIGRLEVNDAAEQTRNGVVVALILVAAFGAALSFFLHRSIVMPLKEFGDTVERVGQGDLTATFVTTGRDEISALGASLNRMVAGLKSVAIQTRLVAESLNSATAEILASTQQQAAGTAEQAAAVQQANATMTEISQSGAQISERARQVAATAEAASAASAVGMQAVRNTTGGMRGIQEQAEAVAENIVALNDKTQAIGEIIDTVNEIAEQSHLLAVNAAIQAAVAGEHGRSFSVVANEIRNLAAQSKRATSQVRTILGDIQRSITTSVMLTEEAVKRVDAGREQAGVSQRTIEELTSSIEESVRAFQQIVGGSSQQQIGFEQVTQAFRNIGIASQQTATSTKQLETAAASLNTLAVQLRAAVGRYHV